MTVSLLLLLLAAPGASELERRAVVLYKEGEAAYRAGDYDAAIQAFRAADAIAPSPEYDFNIAQSYRKMGDCEKALLAYRNYVQLKPAAIEVKLVRDQLAEMDACVKAKQGGDVPVVVAEPAPVQSPAPEPAVVEVPPPVLTPQPAAVEQKFTAHPIPEAQHRFTAVTLGLAAGGLVLGAVGTGLWNASITQYGGFAASCMTACNPNDTRGAQQEQNIGIGLLAGGAVVLAVAFVFFLVDSL